VSLTCGWARRVKWDIAESTFGSSVITATFESVDDGTLVRLHAETTRNHDIAFITSVVERARARRALRRVLGALVRLTAAATEAEQDSQRRPAAGR
jgi:phosphoribosylaminoimidazole carboxylase (NCAIR synthetase)